MFNPEAVIDLIAIVKKSKSKNTSQSNQGIEKNII